jgi:hypothetical protein
MNPVAMQERAFAPAACDPFTQNFHDAVKVFTAKFRKGQAAVQRLKSASSFQSCAETSATMCCARISSGATGISTRSSRPAWTARKNGETFHQLIAGERK